MPFPIFLRLLTTVLTLMVAVPGTSFAQDPDTPGKKQNSKKESEEDAHRKQRKLAHELQMAQLALNVAEIQAKIRGSNAAGAMAKAALEIEQARHALQHLVTAVAPLEVREATISLDSARFQAEHAKDELAELEAMYKAEEFAEMTKELVLKRGRRQLELANRRLVVQQTKLDHLKTTHARKRKDLEAKVTAADRADSQAKLEHQKAQIETQIALSSARFKIEDLGEQIREVEKKLREKGDTH